MLVIGACYLVVPMFQLTPAYPVWLTRLVPTGLFLVLCLWSLQLLPDTGVGQAWQSAVILAGMLLAGLFAVATLWLQSRRRQTDTTFVFWRGAMLALLALAASWLVLEALPPPAQHRQPSPRKRSPALRPRRSPGGRSRD